MIKNGTGKVPGLLTVLALVPDPRRPQGRRSPLVFVLAVAARVHTGRGEDVQGDRQSCR